MAIEVKKLKEELEVEAQRIFLAFHSQHRSYICMANDTILDNWLTANELPLSLENLNLAFQNCHTQLAVVNDADLKARQAERQAQKVQAAADADIAKAAEARRAADEAAGLLPVEYTRKRIIDMNNSEYVPLLKKYGKAQIEQRVNARRES